MTEKAAASQPPFLRLRNNAGETGIGLREEKNALPERESAWIDIMIGGSFLRLELIHAGLTDVLALIVNNILRTVAENTGPLKFLEDYHITVGIDLDKISDIDIECPS